jgi:hypothetical protein
MTRLLDVAPQVRAVLCIAWLEEITQAAPSTRLIQAPAELPVGMRNRIFRGRRQKYLMHIAGGWMIIEAVFL